MARHLPNAQPEQLAYYQAQAIHKVNQEELDRRIARIPRAERYMDGRTEQAFVDSGWYESRDQLSQAENTLVEWGFRMIEIHGDIMGIKANAADLAKLRAGWRKHIVIAEKLIDACARLHVNPTK